MSTADAMMTAIGALSTRTRAAVGAAVVGAVAAKLLCRWYYHQEPEGSMDTVPNRYFSQSYFEARQKFRALAGKAGATLTAHEVYTDPTTGHTYTMDVAVLKGDAPDRVFVHTSGVHGVEGYAGSAIQCRLLERAAERGGHDGKGPTVVLVHAVNPYGMATWRRFNENNVDLNRNHHVTAEAWAAMKARDANIAGYETFRSMLCPDHAPTRWDYTALLLRAASLILRHGFVTLKTAIVTGQYHDPHGMFYGGAKLEKSLEVLHQVLAPYRNATRYAAVDVHTGLGPSGVDTILADKDAEVVRSVLTGVVVQGADADSGAGSGYNLAAGTVDYKKIFAPASTGFGVTQEFGTVPGIFVARAMILENAAHRHARGSWSHEVSRRILRDVFYVQSDAWRASIVSRGERLFDQGVAYLRGEASANYR